MIVQYVVLLVLGAQLVHLEDPSSELLGKLHETPSFISDFLEPLRMYRHS